MDFMKPSRAGLPWVRISLVCFILCNLLSLLGWLVSNESDRGAYRLVLNGFGGAGH
jgi:hypothetical protein